MSEYETLLFRGVGWLTQFLLAFAGFALILRLAVSRPTRWRVDWRGWRTWAPPSWLLRMCRADRESVALQERKTLLEGCGLRLDPRLYLTLRRLGISLLLTIVTLTGAWGYAAGGAMPVPWSVTGGMAALAAAAVYDGKLLGALRRYRADRIRRELAAVASQLLYYAGSRLHLHGKLMRCLTLTRTIRGDFERLLNEWYHDPDRALRSFKSSLGTEEAYGFSECLRSLRQYESEDVYDMLRELIRETKSRVAMAKEGRKETASYVLFVLAGIPILYTFQIFLYPWVQEAARMFEALNP